MRVTLCVDALGPQLGGIGRYTWQLCSGLAERDDISLNLFARNRLIKDPARLLEGRDPARRRRGLRRLGAWWDSRQLKNGVVHGPNFFLPPFAERGVITVHDLSVFRYPETHPLERIRAFERDFQRSLERASHIITDTETVRNELIAEFSVDPDRVSAVHLGVDSSFSKWPDDMVRAELASLGLSPKRYGLCVSTLEPRKRIGELLSVWRRLPTDLRNRFPLVLAGGEGWRNEQLRIEIERGAAEGWLRPLGFVEDAKLPALYAGATLFVYPSIYEGFGLPPLEAMACGTPVVVAPRSCLPEICGEAVLYADPADPEQLLAALEKGLSDQSWQAEASLRGIERASAFTWDRCIGATVDVYRKVA